MTPLALAGAGALGAAFGYGAQRGAFCMNSAFRNVLADDWTRVKALALAVAVQLVCLPALFALGWAQAAAPGFRPLGALAGGVLFGLSMRWAGACAAGAWYKLGAGDVGALLAVVGMALGATAAEVGPASAIRERLQGAQIDSWTAAPAASLGAGVLLLAAVSRLADGRAGAWSWRRTGLWIGATATLAWPLSALAGRGFGLAVVPGTVGAMTGISGHAFSAWDVIFVLGLPLGGWLGARRAGRVTLSAPGPGVLLQRFAGGLGLGAGAALAAGCTVGQGLTGLALLAPSSFLVMLSILGGVALATTVERWAGLVAPRPSAAARDHRDR